MTSDPALPGSTPPAGVNASPGPAPVSLLHRSPLQIGFLGVLGGVFALALITALIALQNIVLVVLFSLFLALGLNPGVEWLNRRGLPRALAVLAIVIAVLAAVALALWAVLPLLNEQIANLITNTPGFLQALRENRQIAGLDARYGVIDKATQFITSGTWLTTMFGGLVGAGRLVADTVFSVIMTLVLTLYFLASLPSIKATVYQLAPASRRPRVRYLANEMFRRIGAYITGMFLVVTLWAVGSTIVMYSVGLAQYALALAVLVAIFAFIPVVGSTCAMIIVSIVAFSSSPTAGAIVLAYFLIYQQLDAYVVQPRVFSRSMNVPGVLVILGAISGGLLFGIIGALVAIPTVASLLLLYREVLVPHLDAR
ncbi:AI-2E family transporter [Nigerium massiliense]|uniref:AI-2E family transporter n=1 Tax=Nigerium massiliense TaxID=1522317 RepID=UPI000693D837|nr:AI-2E family transporter [Nigerium massiliense]